MSEVIYIYNPEQANFYMQFIKCIKTGIHKKTKKTFWVFNREETNVYYNKWCNRKNVS